MKPLVDLSLLDAPMHQAAGSSMAMPAAAVSGTGTMTPADIVASALAGEDVHFETGGAWSLHELLSAALETLGPCAVSFSTFSITEYSARVLAIAREAGRIRELNVLLNSGARARYAQVYQLLSCVADRLCLAPVHAKALVMEGAAGSLTVIGSANLTENPRVENGLATSSAGAAGFHKQWILKAINEHVTTF